MNPLICTRWDLSIALNFPSRPIGEAIHFIKSHQRKKAEGREIGKSEYLRVAFGFSRSFLQRRILNLTEGRPINMVALA